jgi:hypothetical protein
VVIGPHDRGVRDAALLEAAGGLVRLPRNGAASALAMRWGEWLDDPARVIRDGSAAHDALEGDRGAALRNARLLVDLLERGGQRPSA